MIYTWIYSLTLEQKSCLHMMQLLSCGNCTPVWSSTKLSPRASNLKCLWLCFCSVNSLNLSIVFLHCVVLSAVYVPFWMLGYDLLWFLGVWGIHTFTVHAEFVPPSPLTCLLITTAPGLLTLWSKVQKQDVLSFVSLLISPTAECECGFLLRCHHNAIPRKKEVNSYVEHAPFNVL